MDTTLKIAVGLAAATALVVLAGSMPGIRRLVPGAPEPPSHVLRMTAQAYPAVKDQSKPVLMDFWAPWCGPCRTQGPIVEQFASLVGDRVLVAKVNVDDERALAQQYGVRAIPTLVILKNGKEVKRLVGVHSAADLLAAVDTP
jgi:thioredoxin 1